MLSSLNPIAGDLSRGNFNELSPNSKRFLRALDLLDSSEYPDVSQSKIAQQMLSRLQKNKNKVTDIQKELVTPLVESEYGLEETKSI